MPSTPHVAHLLARFVVLGKSLVVVHVALQGLLGVLPLRLLLAERPLPLPLLVPIAVVESARVCGDIQMKLLVFYDKPLTVQPLRFGPDDCVWRCLTPYMQ